MASILICLAILANSIILVNSACPANTVAVPFGNYCLLKSQLPVNISSAQGACNYAGGNLVSIHSDDENNFLVTALTDAPLWMIGGYIQFYGVDLPNNTWMWYDNSSFDYNNFWKYQNYGEYTAQFTMSATEHDPGIWEFGTKSDQLPFACYITQPPLSPPSNQQCPQGSSYLSTLNRCLMPVTTGASFDGAEKNCASVGGHLPAVFSAFQNNALCDFITSYMPNITVDRTFLGLDNYNGTWLFTDGNQPMSYSNWETPNEVNQTEAYAYIEMKTRKWVSVSKIIDLVIPMPYVCAFVPWT